MKEYAVEVTLETTIIVEAESAEAAENYVANGVYVAHERWPDDAAKIVDEDNDAMRDNSVGVTEVEPTKTDAA